LINFLKDSHIAALARADTKIFNDSILKEAANRELEEFEVFLQHLRNIRPDHMIVHPVLQELSVIHQRMEQISLMGSKLLARGDLEKLKSVLGLGRHVAQIGCAACHAVEQLQVSDPLGGFSLYNTQSLALRFKSLGGPEDPTKDWGATDATLKKEVAVVLAGKVDAKRQRQSSPSHGGRGSFRAPQQQQQQQGKPPLPRAHSHRRHPSV
jgi:hypothetical protein